MPKGPQQPLTGSTASHTAAVSLLGDDEVEALEAAALADSEDDDDEGQPSGEPAEP